MRDAKNPADSPADILDARLAIDRAVFADLSRGVSLEDALTILCQTVELQSPGMLCCISIFNETRDRLRVVAAPNLPPDFKRAIDNLSPQSLATSWVASVARNESVLVQDIANDPLWVASRASALAGEIRAASLTPICSSKGPVLGCFSVYFSEPRLPANRERQLIKWAAPLVAMTVERKQIEDSLRSQRAELQTILDAAPAMIFYKDKQNRILRANRAALEAMGRQRHEVEGRAAHELYPKEGAAAYQLDLEVIQSGKPKLGVLECHEPRPGEKHWIVTDRFPYLDGSGAIVGVVMFARNITEQKAAEAAREQAELRYRSLVEQLPAVIYIAEYGAHGRWSYVAPQIESLLGFSPEEWLANPSAWLEQVHPEDKERVVAQEETSAVGGLGFVSEYRMLTKAGKIVWVRDQATILPEEPGKPRVMQGVLLDITESKEAKSALRSTEERLAVTVSNAPVVLFSIDREGRFTLSEGMGLKGLGLSPGQVVGLSVYDVYRDYPEILNSVRRALAGEEFTSTIELPDRKLVYETKWTARRDPSGDVVGVTGIATDVSTRRLAEEALRESEEKYRTIAETASDGIVTIDSKSQILFANSSMQRIFGYSPGELVGTSLTQLMPEYLRELHSRAVHRYLATGRRHINWEGIELEGLHRDGQKLLLEVSFGESVRNGVHTFTGAVRDISQRKQSEETILRERAMLDQVLQLSPDHIYFKDTQSRFTRINLSQAEWLGLKDPAEALGKSDFDFFAPEHAQRALADEQLIIRTGQPISGKEEKEVWPDGRITWVMTTKTPLFDPQGSVVGVMGVSRDITERKQAEAAANMMQERLSMALAASGMCMWDCDIASGNVYLSDDWSVMLGGERKETRTTISALWELTHPDDQPKLQAAAARTVSSSPGEPLSEYREEHRVRNLAGEWIWLESTGKIVERDARGNPLRLIGTNMDISKRKQAEEELRKTELQLQVAQKIEAVGRLAGGIAHDFNNLLMIINGQLELLYEKLNREEEHRRKIALAQRATDRAASLTRQLLAFSRMQALQPQVISLNAILSEMSKLLPPLVGPNITLDLKPAQQLNSVKADPGQVEQVILNLVVNARDAMAKGGKLTIETANVEVDSDYASLHPPLLAGHYVMLAVSDTGIGMDPDTQARIFEPFFTTKEKGKGTGLGLASVYGVVKQSGGYILVDSAPARGSTFRIYLPPVDEIPTLPRSPDSGALSAHGTETILLAEDEHDVREIAREFLLRFGYTVLEARNAADALDVAKKYPGQIHVLLTDMIMPGISGSELAIQLTAIRPDLKVVYMSGYSEYNEPGAEPDRKVGVLLHKPFTRDSLARTIRETLDNE